MPTSDTPAPALDLDGLERLHATAVDDGGSPDVTVHTSQARCDFYGAALTQVPALVARVRELTQALDDTREELTEALAEIGNAEALEEQAEERAAEAEAALDAAESRAREADARAAALAEAVRLLLAGDMPERSPWKEAREIALERLAAFDAARPT
jgi:hypothetical protein